MDKYLALLFAAHFIADFLLQPDRLVQLKNHTGYLFVHSIIHAAVTYLILQNWTVWLVPLLVFSTHILIDFIKQLKTGGNDSSKVLVADQAAHLISLSLIVMVLQQYSFHLEFTGAGYKIIIIIASFSLVVIGSGYFIGKYMKEILDENKLSISGLVNGGKLIGQFERLLILVLIYIGQPIGIGFLVAAKSILRFEEAKNHKIAEYVIIGTLLSFALAIIFSSLTIWVVNF